VQEEQAISGDEALRKLIIQLAPTGMVPQSLKRHTPITPEEIARDTYDAYKLASAVHVHA
jgi:uncharacterized protein (DUF849 family)